MQVRRAVMLAVVFGIVALPCLSIAAEDPPAEDGYYKIVELPIPEGVVLEGGALALLSDGNLAVGSRRGEIWLVENPLAEDPATMKFRRFAHGLHEVLGLTERDGWLYVTQRCEVARIRDEDGDGTADRFETVCDGWGVTGDYHEYAFGSPFDAEGNLWVVLCLTGSFTSEAPYRGWCLRVGPDGTMVPTCSGLRSPGGIAMNHRGDMFYTDNQGPWNGTCSLRHLESGKFMGHPAGNTWYELTDALGPRPADPESGSRIHLEAAKIPELQPPSVWFPYAKMGQSASGIACDTTGGKFGPFENQLFVGDQTHSTVMRVALERVNGHYQGACFPFRQGFGSGSLALLMPGSGQLFVTGSSRGWGSRGTKPFALERLDWTGRVPFEIAAMHVRPDGFELRFTAPVDSQSAGAPEAYRLQTYTYLYQSSYGSPEVDQTTPTIKKVQVAEDGLSVRLTVDGLQVGHVHELHASGVKSAEGLPLLHEAAYYTLFELPRSEDAQ